jgi:hypothetical protein
MVIFNPALNNRSGFGSRLPGCQEVRIAEKGERIQKKVFLNVGAENGGFLWIL